MNITLEVELSPIEEIIVSVLARSQWKYSVKALNFNLKEEGYIAIIWRIEVGSLSNKHYLYFV